MAGTLTCGGFGVVEARISMPRVGVWSGALVVETDTALSGAVEIKTDAGTTLRGKVRHAGQVVGACNAFVVGGADGMGTLARPKFYRSPTLRIILGDLARDAGESLDSTCDAATLARTLPHWTTMEQPTGEAVAGLLRYAAPDAVWRVLPGGGLWVGPESWAASSASYTLLQDMPEEEQWQVGMDSPEIFPGCTLGGRKVDRVEYTIRDDKVRATVWILP